MVIDVHSHEASDVFTDPPLTNFTGGWAVHPFVGRKPRAHFWNKPWREGDVQMVYSRCGQKTAFNKQVPMLGRGNAPECMRCRGVLARERRQMN